MKKTSTGNAFDDILYNSDSDLGSDGEDDAAPTHSQGARGGRPGQQQGGRQSQAQQFQQQQKGGKKDNNANAGAARKRENGASYIRNEGDEPMDLLSRSIAGNVACEFNFCRTQWSRHASQPRECEVLHHRNLRVMS